MEITHIFQHEANKANVNTDLLKPQVCLEICLLVFLRNNKSLYIYIFAFQDWFLYITDVAVLELIL